jgi:hypothetical protein
MLNSLSPPDVALGDTVIILGANFLPDPYVLLNNVLVTPIAVSANQIKIVVPLDLPLSSCIQPVDVQVANGAGVAGPLTLRVHRATPRLNIVGVASVTAGTVLSLSGADLGGATATVDGRGLTTQSSTDTTILLNIPRDISAGHHTLAVKGSCGEADTDLLVLSPAPRIISADLATVAPNGVLLMTVDVSNGASIVAVQVGAEQVSSTDPDVFRWLDQSDLTKSVVAVRMPGDLAPGSIDIRLQGPTEQGDPYAMAIVSSSLRAPSAATGALVFPPSIATDDPFPVSSMSPFPLVDMRLPIPPIAQWYWTYYLEFPDTGSLECVPSGSFFGDERHCPDPGGEDGGSSLLIECVRAIGCTDTDVCNRITGTYTLSSTGNHVDMFIDRGAPEGQEHFAGGWVQADGSPPSSTTLSEFLVVRSLRTGAIITIDHGFDPGHSPYCLSQRDASAD